MKEGVKKPQNVMVEKKHLTFQEYIQESLLFKNITFLPIKCRKRG